MKKLSRDEIREKRINEVTKYIQTESRKFISNFFCINWRTIRKSKINIMVISTSEIKISVLIEKKLVKKAVKALHKEFDLNKEYNLD